MVMVRYEELTDEQKRELVFSEEERRQLDEAKLRPIVYDEDCPAVTPEKAVQFRRVHPSRKIKSSK